MSLSPRKSTLSELMASKMLKPTITVIDIVFIDFIKKISVVEKNLPKEVLLWERKGVKWKIVTATKTNK